MKKILVNIDDLIASFMLVGVVVITVVNVIFRFIFNSPILWAEEVSLAFYVWLVFIGASSTMKRNGHIGIDFFVEKMPPAVKNGFKVLRILIMYFIFVYVFIYLGIKFTAQAALKVTPALGVSYQWIDIAVPLGGALLMYQFTKIIKKSFQNDAEQKGEF